MALVPAICTQCGSKISVDDTKETGFCEACGTKFLTEQVINNYEVTNNINISNATINVSGADINNLLVRAMQFEEEGAWEKAKEYYNKVLDIDANHALAKARLEAARKLYIGNIRVEKNNIENIKRLMYAGQKIEAIKYVREISGLGLANAKYFVENYEQLDLYNPQNFEGENMNQKSNGGCYIATCVYGAYDCPEVWTLRRYRDSMLGTTWYGQVFIRIYYAISPTLVKVFGHTKWFKWIWKKKLDRMICKLKEKGVEDAPYNDKIW